MSKKKRTRIDTDDRTGSGHNPFAALGGLDLPDGGDEAAAAPTADGPKSEAIPDRGRVDILRQTAHRGGKAVTVVTNFTGVDAKELRALARRMQKTCGTGGTVKDGSIEIQGEQRDRIRSILEEAGFRPVFAGG